MKNIFLLITTLFVVSHATAQDPARTTLHTLTSNALSEERFFTVQVPESYDTHSSTLFPVLYLLDGESNLAHAGPVVDYLAENGRIPEMIVVAINSGVTRSRDFVPATSDQVGVGAASFLAFLEDELTPLVDSEYRAAPLRLMSGHSLGGLFVTWAMVNGSNVADAFLAQSPYLTAELGPGITELAGTATIGPDVYYHANLGAEPDLASNFDRLQTELASNTSGPDRWDLERNMEETHMSTRLPGLYEGLTGFFGDTWTISSGKLTTGGTAALAEHIQNMEDAYGYPVLVGEQPFQELTQRFLATGDMASAQEAATLYVKHHDASVVAHFMLGIALASSGNRTEGLAEINRAMALYEASPDPELAPVYSQLQQIKQQLGG